MADVKELFNNFTMDDNVNTNLQPIVDLIQEIMNIPEEGLNENSVQILKNMIKSTFPEDQKNNTINEMLKNFETSGSSFSELTNSIQSAKKAFQIVTDDLKPSKFKRELIETIFNIFYEIFDEVVSRYHNITIPMVLEEGAYIPTYAHDTDACADLYALNDMTIPAHSLSNMVHTGLRIALPEGWVMMIDPRSSIGMKTGLRLSNSIGIIDEDYRGEIGIIYDNFSDSDYEIKAGDRIAQCWVQPVYRFKGTKVNELPTTERGDGGFGSTGK